MCHVLDLWVGKSSKSEYKVLQRSTYQRAAVTVSISKVFLPAVQPSTFQTSLEAHKFPLLCTHALFTMCHFQLLMNY